MTASQDLIFEERPTKDGKLGVITLNKPKVLNALNHEMFVQLHEKFVQWEEDADIQAVVIKAIPGRAFCAGGDIRSVYERGKAGDKNIHEFFSEEYALNRRIYHFSKPYIALLNGITMGGGVGISIHASHPVATPQMIFAMPETGIGFYPDVGSTYFLPRLADYIGTYIALTGARLSHLDCYELGLVDYVIHADKQEHIIAELSKRSLAENSHQTVTDILTQFSAPKEMGELTAHKREISLCFSKNSVEDILEALRGLSSPWCSHVHTQLNTKSPTSLKVTLQQMQMGKELEFDKCMDLEMILTENFLHGHDFYEGIRALIIDKDQAPKWKPARLEEISEHMVLEYFAPSHVKITS